MMSIFALSVYKYMQVCIDTNSKFVFHCAFSFVPPVVQALLEEAKKEADKFEERHAILSERLSKLEQAVAGAGSAASDADAVKRQLEEHKVCPSVCGKELLVITITDLRIFVIVCKPFMIVLWINK